MFYRYVRERGFKLGSTLRDGDLRMRMLDDFYREMERED